jgi:hypothetical protein
MVQRALQINGTVRFHLPSLPKLTHLSQVAVKVIHGGASSKANDFEELDMVCFIQAF